MRVVGGNIFTIYIFVLHIFALHFFITTCSEFVTRVWSGEQVLVVMYVVEAGEEVIITYHNMKNICNIYIIYDIYR